MNVLPRRVDAVRAFHLVQVFWPLVVGFDQAMTHFAWSWREMGFAARRTGPVWPPEANAALNIEHVDGCIAVAVVVVAVHSVEVPSSLEVDIQNCCRHMVGKGC